MVVKAECEDGSHDLRILSAMDTKDILKRLELLNNLISLEEFEMVELQKSKLRQGENCAEVEAVLSALDERAYGKAARLIQEYVSSSSAVQVYQDPEVAGLRAEAVVLEKDLLTLEEEKAELEKLIHDFEIRYHQELGELIEKLLTLRREKLRDEAQEDPEKEGEFQEAESDYEEFHRDHEKSRQEVLLDLTDDEIKELKSAYRKASKLCHPDVIADEFKDESEAIFKDLSDAYNKNDLHRVREILQSLEKGVSPIRKSERAEDKDVLKSLIGMLRRKMSAIQSEMENLQQSEAYKTVIGLEDWDQYFSDIKQKLQTEVDAIESSAP